MNVVLIAIDTLRADYLGCYGHKKPTSPNIDKLAKDGVRFRNSFSHSNCTLPGFTTILTGTYPITHNIISHDPPPAVSLQDGLQTASEMFKKLGYVNDFNDVLINTRFLVLTHYLGIGECCKDFKGSMSLSKACKLIKMINKDVKIIVSYVDITRGYDGIIYKASNFTEIGLSRGINIKRPVWILRRKKDVWKAEKVPRKKIFIYKLR